MSRARALDVVIAATLVAVPLCFTTSMRTFAAAKIAVLELGVGAALVLLAFVRARVAPRVAIAIAAVLGLGLVARPDVEGLAASGYLAALAALAVLVATRASAWSHARLVAIVAIPLAAALALALLQSVGLAVLDASATHFGGTHGAVVGTVGNPVELTWLLVLAAALLHGIAPGRASWLAILAIAWIVIVDRSRAAAGIGALALTLPYARRAGVGPRLAAIATLVLAALAVWQWGGALALRGRGVLLGVGASMLAGARLVPQGAGAFARDFPGAQAAALTPDTAMFASELDHAHCDVLELAYELGLPGLAALAWLVLAIVRAVRRDPSPRRCAAAVALAIGAALGVLGYPVFSPACATVLALALGLALAPTETASVRAWPHAITCVVLGVGLVVLAVRSAASELAITSALAAHAAGDDARGLAEARIAVTRFPSADAWFYLGNFELAQGDRARAAAAYRRSIALRPRAVASANLDVAAAASR